MLPQIRRGHEEPQPPRRALSRSRSALGCGVPLFRAPRAAAILFRSGALRPALAARRPAPRGISLGAYVPCVTMSRLKGVSHAKAIVSVSGSGRRSKAVQGSARAIRRTGHWDMACIRCDFLEAQGTIISPVQNLSFKRIVHPCKVVYLVPNVPQIWRTVIDQTRIRL